jgi:hypothetical protein
MVKNDKGLRERLLYLLKGSGAHASFDQAVEGLPIAMRDTRPPGAEHSPWGILDRMRLAQWDILEFTRDTKRVSPEWPKGHWPETQAPPNDAAWGKSVPDRQCWDAVRLRTEDAGRAPAPFRLKQDAHYI